MFIRSRPENRLNLLAALGLMDFEGVYGQARMGWAVGEQGKGQMWLQNSNGVYLRLKARRRGLALSLEADGMVVRLGT